MGFFGVLKALGRHLAAFPPAALAVLATVLFDTLFETAVPLLLSWIVDHAVIPGRADLFLLPAALMVGGWLTSVVSQVGRDSLLAGLAARISGRIRQRLADHLTGLAFKNVRELKTAQWQALHGSDLAQVENLLLNVLPPFLFGVFYLLFGVTAMVFTSPGLGTLVILGLPLTLIGPWLLQKRARAQGEALRKVETEARTSAADLLSAQPLIRTFDLGQAFDRGFRSKVSALVRWTGLFSFTANLTRRFPNLTIHLLQLVLILSGTWMALRGQLGVGDFLAFNLLFANVLTAVLDLASTLGPLTLAAPALENLEKRISAGEPHTAGGQTPAASPGEGLRFEEVVFRYLPSRKVLEGVSFFVPAGKRTAVVGASGSGKSTLAALAAGLYRPESGRLLWNGTDLADLVPGSYRDRLGIVFQENPVFDASLRYNIALGDPCADGPLWVALEQAGLDSWARDLPSGLDTQAGEDGGFLSGGQRQRLALARALYRRPELLVLDEATSALDPITEGLVNDNLRSLAGSMTILHITHRLQGISDYDQIIVLGEGRVLEAGTHDGLLEHPQGSYAALWRRQSGLLISGPEARITPEGLRAIPLFASSSAPTLEALSRSFLSETAEPGSRLIRQGQPGSRFFVVARGRVEVSIQTPAGEIVVANLADGDFFGEMSLLDSALTSATVTATLPTVLLALEKTTFLALVAGDSALGQAVAAIARRRKEENAQRPVAPPPSAP